MDDITDAQWAQKEQDEQRELERTGGGIGKGSGRDHGSAQGFGEPVFQIEVCRARLLLRGPFRHRAYFYLTRRRGGERSAACPVRQHGAP